MTQRVLTIELSRSGKHCYAGVLERASQRLSLAAPKVLREVVQNGVVRCRESGVLYDAKVVWRECGTGKVCENAHNEGAGAPRS